VLLLREGGDLRLNARSPAMLLTPRPEAHVLLARRSVLRIAAPDLRSGLTFDPDDWRVFDVRDVDAYEDGHVDGATHLAPEQLARCRRFRRDRVNVFYGDDSAANSPYLLAWQLATRGYPAAVLEDGYTGWLAVVGCETGGEMDALFAVLRVADGAQV
jgi:rhodanese-related sulfurtransferase